MPASLFLLPARIADVLATTCLTASDGFKRLGPTAGAILGYFVAFYFRSITLRTIRPGMAYAIWSGLGTVLIAIAGWLVFKQRLDAPAIIGMSLIVAGVFVMQFFSKAQLGG